MFKRRGGSISEVGDALDQYLRSKGLLTAGRECLVPIIWPDVVGEWYRKHTEVLRVDKGVVTVRCDSASRAQQLQLDTPRIIELLNERIGAKVIREIRPSSGGISRGGGTPQTAAGDPTGPTESDLAAIELNDTERDWLRETASGVDDDTLRQRVEMVLAKQCKANRWKLERGYRPCVGCGSLQPPGRTMCRACNPGRIPAQGSQEVVSYPWKKNPWDW